MGAATKKLRAEVFARAKGKCECGCGRHLGESGHLDHFFGRGKAAESISNCWGLCLFCDHHKTINKPSARFWLQRFRVHCKRYGFTAELERAESKLAVLVQKGLAA